MQEEVTLRFSDFPALTIERLGEELAIVRSHLPMGDIVIELTLAQHEGIRAAMRTRHQAIFGDTENDPVPFPLPLRSFEGCRVRVAGWGRFDA